MYLSKNRLDSISWWAQAQIMFSSLAHTVKQYLIKWGTFHIIFISVINLFTTLLQVKELFKSLNVTFYALEIDLLGNINNTRKLIKQENWISIFITFLHWLLHSVLCTFRQVLKRRTLFNPLTPLSDQDRISPYNINTISSRLVMRIKKNIS